MHEKAQHWLVPSSSSRPTYGLPSGRPHHMETAGPPRWDALYKACGSLASIRKDGPGEKLRGWEACLGKIMDCESVKPLTKLLELRFFLFSKQ